MSGIILTMTSEARVPTPRPGTVRLFANLNGTLSLKASNGGVSSDIGSAVIEAPGSIEPSGVTLIGPAILGRVYPGAGEAEGITPADLAALVAPYLSTGGSDPWTYIKLASDFVTSSATAVDITGMAFTPAANTDYEFEALLMLRTATATVGPCAGLAWATGMTDGVADMFTPSSGTAQTMVFGNIAGPMLAAVGGLPNTTSSYPVRIGGTVRAGASPSGTVKLQMASETAGTNVTVKAGSFLKYRAI